MVFIHHKFHRSADGGNISSLFVEFFQDGFQAHFIAFWVRVIIETRKYFLKYYFYNTSFIFAKNLKWLVCFLTAKAATNPQGSQNLKYPPHFTLTLHTAYCIQPLISPTFSKDQFLVS